MKSPKFLFVLFAVVALNACEGMTAEYTDPDAGPSLTQTDAGPSPDVGSETAPDASADAAPAPDAPTSAVPCVDNDQDGYCAHLPSGQPFDCNDSNVDADGDGVIDGYLVHPGAAETCDLIDNNCNGQVDEGLEKALRFVDTDGDGYGDINDVEGEEICAMQGYSLTNDDCDDAKPDTHPGADDKGGDGIDSDCDDETSPEDSDPEVVVGLFAEAKLTVSVAKDNKLVLDYQLVATEDKLGGWWEDGKTVLAAWASTVSTTVLLSEKVSFVRVGLTVGGGSTKTWLCNGSGEESAQLAGSTVTLTEESDHFVVGAAFLWDDPAGGCSVVFPIELVE